MSIFNSDYIGGRVTESNNTVEFEDGTSFNLAPYVEALTVDDVSRLPEEQIKEFCKADGIGEALVEAGKLRRKTLVRLSKKDDLQRRQTMAELELAKQHKDPNYAKLVKLHMQMKELDAKIHQRWGNKALMVAKQGQKEYLKQSGGGFLRGGSNDAVR